jgi:class 3 adenylate cyclase/tetratricopeptide (TPR) repeat protein
VHCGACGEVNASTNRFCHGCGTPLLTACAACGHGNPLTAAYCGGCGIRRDTSAPAGPRRAPVPQGELKQVTVLFADLVSSTELVAQLDAESAMWRLRPALDKMCQAVERVGGTVVRTLGDGIMALFGAPHTLERHALLACQAALAIRDAFHAPGETLSIRVGLHSGEAVIDGPSADPALERGAYGLALHLGSRLPAMVQGGGICISDDTYRLVRAFCDVAPLGRHRLRGVPNPVELFQLLSLKPAVASQQFHGAELTPFQGREPEMDRLRKGLLTAERGRGLVIGVVGTPGTGKSRLCYELATWCRRRSIPVYEARAQPYGAATPWQPVIEFLRSAWFRVSPEDDPRLAAQGIARRLADLGQAFEGDLPLVCDFLGVRTGEPPPVWLSPRLRNARLLEIFRAMVRQQGGTTSVIVFEDLHWLDEASEEFLAALVETVPDTHIALVVNFRPAYEAPWMRAAHYQQIDLVELTPSDTGHLVAELLGPAPDLLPLRQQIAERSGGNPFFAEELVRSLVDQGVLTGQRGDYRRGTEGSTIFLPATVQAVIGDRIDHLAPLSLDLLRIGAIIGKDFPLAVLRGVSDRRNGALQGALDSLCAAGMLNPSNAPDGPGYSFRHPLIQEVVYSTQLKAVRGARHAAVARTIEDLNKERLDESAALLSFHFEEAGDIQNAAMYAARAARWFGGTSPAQAIRYWHKVRMLMENLPRTPDNDGLRIMASGQIAWLGWREGLTADQARPFIREALDWARESDDQMVPLLLFVEGRIAGASGGEADAYVSVVKSALAQMKPERDAGRIATLSASLCQAYGWAGLMREALAANDAALAGVPYVTDFDNQFLGYSVEHWALSLRGRILLKLGRFDEARACFDQMLGDPRSTDPVIRQISAVGLVELAASLNDLAMAETFCLIATERSSKDRTPYLEVYASAAMGITAMMREDFAAARNHFSLGLSRLRDGRVAMEFEPELLAYVAESKLRQGDSEGAIKSGKESIWYARARAIRLAECRALLIVAIASLSAETDGIDDQPAFLLRDAEALVQMTGVQIYDALLDEARAAVTRGSGLLVNVGRGS